MAFLDSTSNKANRRTCHKTFPIYKHHPYVAPPTRPHPPASAYFPYGDKG